MSEQKHDKANVPENKDAQIEQLLKMFGEEKHEEKPTVSADAFFAPDEESKTSKEALFAPIEEEKTASKETSFAPIEEEPKVSKEAFFKPVEEKKPEEKKEFTEFEDIDSGQSDEALSKEININKKKEPFSVNLENDKEYKKIRSYHKVKPKRQYRLLRFLFHFLLAVIILLFAAALGFMILQGVTDILGINQEDNEIIVEIAPGSSLTDISEQLEEEGVILSGKLFKLWDGYADMSGEYQFGTFVLNTKMSYEEIMTELKQYNIAKETVRVTFPEGSTLLEISKLLEENGVCDDDAFLSAINETNFSYSFMQYVSEDDMKYFKMEGFAFPHTYDFYLEDNPVSVAQKFLYNLEKKFTDDMYTRIDELGISFEDFMTLASIVQAEAITKEQMENVASVYWNRLNNPSVFPLMQADATRVYGREIKKDMQIINNELITAYDTYESAGLPPGPICSPGMEAINATLYPAETEYFYFCSDLSTGECFYAATLEEHNVNLRKCGLR